jgi:transcriptional regulator with XRE-family HTH domain
MKKRRDPRVRLTTDEVAHHLGGLVRQARLAHYTTVERLASDARVSIATVKRIEAGSGSVSLKAWLAVFESTCLLQRLAAVQDPIAESVLAGTGARRGGRKRGLDEYVDY